MLLLLLLEHLQLLLNRRLELELLLLMVAVIVCSTSLRMVSNKAIVIAGGPAIIIQIVTEEHGRVG